jgi:hypothetical protein
VACQLHNSSGWQCTDEISIMQCVCQDVYLLDMARIAYANCMRTQMGERLQAIHTLC